MVSFGERIQIPTTDSDGPFIGQKREAVRDSPFAWWSRVRVPVIALNGEPVIKTSGTTLAFRSKS